MCGIFGVTNGKQVASSLLKGLQCLEYRGYDSAGIATMGDGAIQRRRAVGKLSNLVRLLEHSPLDGTAGIAHTRWATHGVPSELNAHPHITDKVAVVHNGIIENYRELRDSLTALGYHFGSETDSEVIPQLITHYLDLGFEPEQAIRDALSRLRGSYAVGILINGQTERLYAARRGSPLAIGIGEKAAYLASDSIALAQLASRVMYLEDGDVAVLECGDVLVLDREGAETSRVARQSAPKAFSVGRGNYRHYMQKEIYEQPAALQETLRTFTDEEGSRLRLPEFPFHWKDLNRLSIVACGTSFHAAMVGKYWFERFARLPVDVDIASEYRYRDSPLDRRGAGIFISQSGETADTMAALRHARENGQNILSIVNVDESSIARESDAVMLTQAGPEIGVASTKAFTTQLLVLAILALAAARDRGTLSPQRLDEELARLRDVPAQVSSVLRHENLLCRLATQLYHARDVLYLGRGACFPVALEGALKLKEISYIHAEGYAAGEMKHGPIALIDPDVPVIVIAPRDGLFDKIVSNLKEVTARHGKVFLLSDGQGVQDLRDDIHGSFVMPDTALLTAPLVYTIPVQLLAYHIAVLKGTDVDKPRNLAKSVTVE